MSGPAETAIGVDVGGTRVRVARVTRGGAVLERLAEPVARNREGFAAQLLRLIAAIREDGDCAVGVGIPGRVDSRAGVIVSAGYVDIAGLDLPHLIGGETGLPARIENDATMALLAEGALRPGGRDGLVFMVTVGTGVGGAAMENGAPWYGGGFSGQFGHMVVAEDGPQCNCGRRGCVETFSSGTALVRLVAEAGLPEGTRAETLLENAATGDGRAQRVLDLWARPLHRAIETLGAVADPRLVLIGGGLGAPMAQALARMQSRSAWFDTPVEAARLGDEAGVIGAGLCALGAVGAHRQGVTA